MLPHHRLSGQQRKLQLHRLPQLHRLVLRRNRLLTRASSQQQGWRTKQGQLQSLFEALTQQFTKESLPWIQDLVVPWLEGEPRPLSGTVAPQELAESDSKFVQVRLAWTQQQRDGLLLQRRLAAG